MWHAALLALLTVPAGAQAQALQCSVDTAVPRPRPDLPTASQPRRIVPIGSYTLAITWSPQYCRDHARDRAARAPVTR